MRGYPLTLIKTVGIDQRVILPDSAAVVAQVVVADFGIACSAEAAVVLAVAELDAVVPAVGVAPADAGPGCSCYHHPAEHHPGSADDRRAAAWCPACRR